MNRRAFAYSATTLLVGLGLAVPSYAAVAEPPTCHGQAATIVGTDAQTTGTEGNDVIVSPSYLITALGGDDLVCTTGQVVTLDAGNGNDTVDVTSTTGQTVVRLGAGDDIFTGGSGFDNVRAGSGDDVGRDVIDTGAGGSYVKSGTDGVPNADQIYLGDATSNTVTRIGNHLSYAGTPSAAGSLSFGPGTVKLAVRLPGPGNWVVDQARDSITRTVFALVWHGVIDNFELRTIGADEDTNLTFLGSSVAETVLVNTSGTAPVLTLHMRGGGDAIRVGKDAGAVGSIYSMGSGRDTIALNWRRDQSHDRTRVDLDDHRVDYGPTRNAPDAVLNGVEEVRVGGVQVRVVGDEKSNTITAAGCDIQLLGGPGGDTLLVERDAGNPCQPTGLLRGGPGPDELTGAGGDDTLIGGPGSDRAVGRSGTDTCRAEVVKNCERS